MRTTIDLPDALYRRAKSHAALRGIKLKELVAEALEAAMTGRTAAGGASLALDRDAPEDVLDLAEDCRLPRIRGACGEAMRAGGARFDEVLEDEDARRALSPGRR